MVSNKEKNFVSAIVYVRDNENEIETFLSAVTAELSENFDKYEIICVNDASKDKTVDKIKQFMAVQKCHAPLTIVNMSIVQGIEMCMNAGIDISIGDFIFEFDTVSLVYDKALIMQSYRTALTGYDIVSVSPKKVRGAMSGLFYALFNSSSKSKNKLRTDAFRLLSRRALNRVHAISPNMPYRKAAYATSGLKLTCIEFEPLQGVEYKSSEDAKLDLAVDSLALYTDAAYKLSLGISMAMLCVTFFAIIYTLVLFFSPLKLVEGWVTTMLILSGGFFGVFLILAIVLKYLSLLVNLVFKQQKYLIESIEKVQND